MHEFYLYHSHAKTVDVHPLRDSQGRVFPVFGTEWPVAPRFRQFTGWFSDDGEHSGITEQNRSVLVYKKVLLFNISVIAVPLTNEQEDVGILTAQICPWTSSSSCINLTVRASSENYLGRLELNKVWMGAGLRRRPG